MNLTTADLDLSQHPVGSSLAAKAIEGLQRACSEHAPLEMGQVAETGGFELGCKKILHCICPPYETEKATKDVS